MLSQRPYAYHPQYDWVVKIKKKSMQTESPGYWKYTNASSDKYPCLKVHAVYRRIFTCTPFFKAEPPFEIVCTGLAFWFPSLKRIKPYKLQACWNSDVTALSKPTASKPPSLLHCSVHSTSFSGPPWERGAFVSGVSAAQLSSFNFHIKGGRKVTENWHI